MHLSLFAGGKLEVFNGQFHHSTKNISHHPWTPRPVYNVSNLFSNPPLIPKTTLKPNKHAHSTPHSPSPLLHPPPSPTHQPIRHIPHIPLGRALAIIQLLLIHTSRIIPPERTIPIPFLRLKTLLKSLSTIWTGHTLGAVADHLENTALWV